MVVVVATVMVMMVVVMRTTQNQGRHDVDHESDDNVPWPRR